MTSGHVFLVRGRRGDLLKVLWCSGDGLCLFAKRLERGRFVWPQATIGSVSLGGAQLSMFREGIDLRRPERTWHQSQAVSISIVCLIAKAFSWTSRPADIFPSVRRGLIDKS